MWQKNVLLKNYSSYQIGGPAKFFFEAKTPAELSIALKEAAVLKEKVFILGGGTNILFSDNGFDGVVIKISIGGIQRQANQLTVGAGVLIKDLLNFCIIQGLSGLEWAGGLPGTLGGAIRGNAGAFGGEIKDSILTVKSLTMAGVEKIRTKEECQFSYRSSVFKELSMNKEEIEIITEAVLNLQSGDSEEIQKLITEKISYRLNRHPLNYPNAGSVFKNVDLEKIPAQYLELVKPVVKNDPLPVVPAAFLIAESGLKGRRIGGAVVSDQHSNFIVNTGNAVAADVKALIALIKKTVFEKFNIELTEEILIMSD